MLVISHDEVGRLLSMESCIELMETVFTDLARGDAVQSLRGVLPIEGGSVLGVMPAYLKREAVAGAKMITIFPANHRRQLPAHQGVVALFDATNGAVKAMVNGQEITAIRTAAASAVATKVLAKPDASRLALLGTGEQARSHLAAMCCVRALEEVTVWGPHPENAYRFQTEMTERFRVPVRVCETVRDAVRVADIICTVTASNVPVLKREWVQEGAHINAVGACRANDRELDTKLVKAARFYADRVESASHESGDYLIPLAEGAIERNHLIGELGDLLVGRIVGRTSNTEITIFKSLGLAIEDLAAANFICDEAVRLQVGTHVDF